METKNTQWVNYGTTQVGNACAKKRDIEAIASELVRNSTTPEGKAAYLGAMRAATELLAAALKAQPTVGNFNLDVPGVNEIVASIRRGDAEGAWLSYLTLHAQNDKDGMSIWHQIVFGSLEYLRQQGWEFSAAAAIPEPSQIQIVAMPDREHLTSVVRGADDLITSTTVVERDIHQPEQGAA